MLLLNYLCHRHLGLHRKENYSIQKAPVFILYLNYLLQDLLYALLSSKSGEEPHTSSIPLPQKVEGIYYMLEWGGILCWSGWAP